MVKLQACIRLHGGHEGHIPLVSVEVKLVSKFQSINKLCEEAYIS